MMLKPGSYNKIVQLIDKGVILHNPLTLDIGEEVKIENISGNQVKIFPGCRIYGADTVISMGATIGYEGPVTIDDCQIGPHVELKGGYFNRSVFLDQSSMGLGAHVREGCILEEQANGAHCVGLKQAILFPFVTLGSLINFCDCLMAGGTSRKDHSEVGSSYIHFNFTPDGDKTTASLIGDVPRGVMLNQPPIFLGGQGGMVGPLRLGYGNIVAAGTVLREDVIQERKLIFGKGDTGKRYDTIPWRYANLSRIVGNNILYLSNLIALEQWYIQVRQPFFQNQEFGSLIYAGVLDKLKLARKERTKRLKDLAEKVKSSLKQNAGKVQDEVGKKEFSDAIDSILELFSKETWSKKGIESRDLFLNMLDTQRKKNSKQYIECIKSLPASASQVGTQWLEAIIHAVCSEASSIVPSLNLFKKKI